MNKRILLVTMVCVVLMSFNTMPVYGADPGSDSATCAITITVNSIIEWEGANFAAINLAAITSQASAPTGNAIYTLWTNCNVELSSDRTNASELTHQRGVAGMADMLVTKYKISTDGDGVATTGATAADVLASSASTWTTYDNFLATHLQVTHFNTDGAVEVTLSVQATNDADNVADSGAYSATQTITAAWVSDN